MRGARRGVSPLIGAILLVGITIAAGATLWAFQVKLPAASPQIWYDTSSSGSMQAYGDGSDCKTVGANQTQVCELLPAITITVTSFQPSSLPIADLQLYFVCEGTVYLSGALGAMEIVPGSNEVIGGGPNGATPTLGVCGNYTPPQAAFNRFMYFQQMTPGDPNLESGDEFVISAQSFSPSFCSFAPSTANVCWVTAAQNAAVTADSKNFPSSCPSPGYAPGADPAKNGSFGLDKCDDDYHGVPTSACYSVVSACTLMVQTTQNPALALSVPFYGLYGGTR